MKNMLPFLFLFFAPHVFSQVNAILPTEAKVFYENAMLHIKPEVRTFIEKNANKLTGHKINVDSLEKELKKSNLLKHRNESELHAIAILILVQASKNADDSLKEMVIHKKQPDSESEIEKERDKDYASRLVENKSEIAETVLFMMKKLSGTQQIIMKKFE